MAWKTGTSFGFRDAWAIGTTPSYVVAVWAGNADGEGEAWTIGHNLGGAAAVRHTQGASACHAAHGSPVPKRG
ncbi:MAG: hypothetical protein MZV63_12885 [Marinilabiliales bacterium]|nr:hypothetical protein [Marinilabiliales bacterium]